MRILTRQAFLALPANTAFSTYGPCIFGPLAIKGDTIYSDGRAIDFFYQDLQELDDSGSSERFDNLERAQETGESLAFDLGCQTREGLFDDSMLYAIWEKKDVEQLVARLSECL